MKTKELSEKQVNDLLSIAAKVNKTTVKRMKSKERTRFVHESRCMVAVVLRRYGWTLQAIGDLLGGRNHASILNAVNHHNESYVVFDYYEQGYDELLYRLGITNDDKELEAGVLQKKAATILKLEEQLSRAKHENISLRHKLAQIKRNSENLTLNLSSLCN